MYRTVATRWLGPEESPVNRALGIWEWYAYLIEATAGAWRGWYASRALGDPARDGGEAPYMDCVVGGHRYDTEDEAREAFAKLVSPETPKH